TALYPEHIDWHRSLDNYYRDKIHLLAQGRSTVINAEAAPMVERFLPNPPLSHLCAALTALRALGIDPAAAGATTADFQGLPHRQQELGERDGVLFVDDSI